MRRLSFLSPTLLATVIVPTLLAVLYYGVFAQDVYISEARIVVRSPEAPPPSPLNLALDQTGFGSKNEGNDAVVGYLRSRQAISEGDQDGLIKSAYSGGDVFWFDRFGALTGQSDEEFYRYFQDHLDVDEGSSSKVLTIRVQAFSPEHAREINQRLINQAENLVNGLASRAQTDLIKLAEGEVDEALEEARLAALELARFRDGSGIVDPAQQSEVGLQMISKLQDELIAAQTRLRQLRTHAPDAVQIPTMQTQVASLRSEIAKARRELTGGSASLSSSMAKYEELQINAKFAESQLAATRASLQDARAEARRKQAYLELVSSPSLPDYPMEPRRIRSILATLIVGALAWGMLTMLAIGVREHRG